MSETNRQNCSWKGFQVINIIPTAIMRSVVLLCFICFLSTALCDLYLHQPRGSNNRLNENTATRANNNRMFDSQNNARGGYNVGDKNQNAARNEGDQYRMKYFQSGVEGDTELTVEWTNQHGCGGDEDTSPHKLNCNMVLQFMCQDDIATPAPDDSITFRNGQQTATQNYQNPNNDNENENTVVVRRNNNVNSNQGLHESWEWYDSCYRRERNKGIFTADQELNDNNMGVSSAIFTRQNPNNNRRGYECPEERDYYPYFHPTPWVDIAVLAHNESSCEYYAANSFNNQTYGECVEQFQNTNRRKHWSTANNPTDCAAKGGSWEEYHSYLELAPTFTSQAACLGQNGKNNRDRYMWGKPYDVKKIVNHVQIVDACFVVPPPLDCKAAEWSRVNHLGNGRDLTPLNYTWILPHFPSNKQKRCVFRMRYNISTDDYDPFNTNSNHNQQKENNIVVQRSPIEQNPLVDIGANGQLLQLAINTDQTGRVFQDRSHVFFIAPRPSGIADDVRILNLNVRGKRGNIVQVYPAVEYDFVPNRFTMTEQDLLHIQWTGSNTHNNNAPGGDGQTGSAGEGTAGTDRSNIVPLLTPSENYPTPWDSSSSLFKNMTMVWSEYFDVANNGDPPEELQKDAGVQLASSGYFHCQRSAVCGNNALGRKAAMTNLLNNTPASFKGMLVRLGRGIYYYMCSRNNNFTNRSQKGQITVV